MLPHKHISLPVVKAYRELLLELTVSYLVKRPADYLDFALDFFMEKLRLSTETRISYDLCRATSDEGLVDERRELVYSGHLEVEPCEGEPRSAGKLEDSAAALHKSEKTVERLTRSLRTFFLFGQLTREQMDLVTEEMEPMKVERGDRLLVEGQSSETCYSVESGYFQATVSVEGKDKVLKTYKDNGCFGEMGLFVRETSGQSVTAVGGGELYSIRGPAFRRLVFGQAESRRAGLRDDLRAIPYLSELDDGDCEAIIDNMVVRSVKGCQVLFEQGQKSEGLFILLDGLVESIRSHEGGRYTTTKSLRPGESFGHISVLVSSGTLGSCTAVTDAEVCLLEAGRFRRLFGPSLEENTSRIATLYGKILEVGFPHNSEIPPDLQLWVSRPK